MSRSGSTRVRPTPIPLSPLPTLELPGSIGERGHEVVPDALASPTVAAPVLAWSREPHSVDSTSRSRATPRGGAGCFAKRGGAGCFAKFTSIHWPKIRNQLREIQSYELWKGQIKKVEAYHGSGVATYFTSLRWLLFVNVTLCLVWSGLVCIPQIVSESSKSNDFSSSDRRLQLVTACVYNSEDLYNCSVDPIRVYKIPANSTLPNTTYVVEYCDHSYIDTVSISLQQTPAGRMDKLILCDPDKETSASYRWYSYILDFFVGEGPYSDSLLFLGHYTDSGRLQSSAYHMPFIILLTVVVLYAISFIIVVWRLGKVYKGNYLEIGSQSSNFCGKVFSAWDFNLTNAKSVQFKKVAITTDLKEELSELQAVTCTSFLIWTVRIITNTIVLAIICASGASIFYVTQWSWKERIEVSTLPLKRLLRQSPILIIVKAFVLPVLINTLRLTLPILFELIAKLEKFKTRSGEIAVTMLRTSAVHIGILITYLLIMYATIRCTQQDNLASCYTGEPLYFSHNGSCINCWETFVGKQFYTLALTSLITSVISTASLDTLMNILHKLFYHRVKKRLLQFIFSKRTFSVSNNMLELITSQFLLWLGFLFFPLHPVFMVFSLTITFYVKWLSLMKNMEQKRRGIFRGALTHFLFTLLLLLVLLIATIPVGYSVVRLVPSQYCGPFKGKHSMVAVVTEFVNSIADCTTKELIWYLGSAEFLVSLNVASCTVIFILAIILKATQKRLKLIAAQQNVAFE